jgi:hypothetical protein
LKLLRDILLPTCAYLWWLPLLGLGAERCLRFGWGEWSSPLVLTPAIMLLGTAIWHLAPGPRLFMAFLGSGPAIFATLYWWGVYAAGV